MVCYNSLGLFLSFGVLREMPEGRCVSFAIPFLIFPFSRPFFLYGLRFSLDYAVSFKYIALWVLLFLNISSFFSFPSPCSLLIGGYAKAKISFLLLSYFVLLFGFFTIDEGCNCESAYKGSVSTMLVLSLFLLFPYHFYPSHHLIVSSFYLISSHPHTLFHKKNSQIPKYHRGQRRCMSPDWFPFLFFSFHRRLTGAVVDFGG